MRAPNLAAATACATSWHRTSSSRPGGPLSKNAQSGSRPGWPDTAQRDTHPRTRFDLNSIGKVRQIPCLAPASDQRAPQSLEQLRAFGHPGSNSRAAADSCSPRSNLFAISQSTAGTAPICRIIPSSSKFSHSSTSWPFSKRLIVMPVKVTELPVGAIPSKGPPCVARAVHLVTT